MASEREDNCAAGCWSSSAVTSSEDESAFITKAKAVPLYPHIVTPKGRYKKLHPCRFCDMVFHKAAKLTIHERSHTGEKPFTCDVCKAAFARNTHLTRHRMTHTEATEKPHFKCDKCGSEFMSKDHLRRHQARHCAPDKHQCTECGLVATSEFHLKKHMGKHRRQRAAKPAASPSAEPPSLHAMPFVCEECNQVLKDRKALKQHITEQHGYKCPDCQKFFSSLDQRREHMRSHTPAEHQCPYEGCSKTYTRPFHLQQHIRSTHLHEREECSFCGALCAGKAVLQRHINRLHQSGTMLPNEVSESLSQPKDNEAVNIAAESTEACDTPEVTMSEVEPEENALEEPPSKRPRLIIGMETKERGPYQRAFWTRLLGNSEDLKLPLEQPLTEDIKEDVNMEVIHDEEVLPLTAEQASA